MLQMLIRKIIVICALPVLMGLSACQYLPVADPNLSTRDKEYLAQIPETEVDRNFDRYLIDDPTREAPGTIIVDTRSRHLYLVLPQGKAIRYGVAVGDETFGWTGTSTVARKAEWPDWNPPAEMKQRWPHVRYTKGGPDSPLGARALYLYEGNKDTLYRIHGTNEPEKIGLAVSSGCIRMRNIDVIELYNRVPVGAKVIVK